MAFVNEQWANWTGESGTGYFPVAYSYWSTTDTLATIIASAYFNELADVIYEGDLVWVVGSDDAELVKFTSDNGVTPVTVAQVTGASANLPLAQGSMFAGNGSGVAAAVSFATQGAVPMGDGTDVVNTNIFAAYPVFKVRHTTSGGAAAEVVTATGVVAGDDVVVTIHTVGSTPRTIVSAAAGTDQITVTFSGDPSTDHIISVFAFRSPA